MAHDPTMSDQLKAALADIQQPPLPDEFYLAPGYIVIVLFIVMLVVWLMLRLLKQYRANGARRIALQTLARIDVQQSDAANQILWLLKQYLQTKKPGHPALALHSAAFLQFLQQSAHLQLPLPELETLLYGPTPTGEQVLVWQNFAQQWLLNHKELALYV